MSKISISQSPLTNDFNSQLKVRDEKWRSKLKNDYITEEVDFYNLFRVVQSDYRCYSAGEFKDNYAKNINWEGQELLILDIDDGLPLKEALEMFSEYKAMIHTSASHQIEKGGKKCDRYRVIIQMKERLSCSVEEYTKTMKFISKKVFDFIDDKCVDPARIYYGHFGCEIFYTDGDKLFDFNKYLSISKKIDDIEKELEQPKNTTGYKSDYKKGDDVIDKFNSENKVEDVLSKNGYKKIGGRYISPNSSTGVPGVILSKADDGKTYAYNHHSSDTWEKGDSFEIYTELEYNGNKSEAVKSLISENIEMPRF